MSARAKSPAARVTAAHGAIPAADREVLDWRTPDHWNNRHGDCVRCGNRTHLVDDDGCFSHKMCCELDPAYLDAHRPDDEDGWDGEVRDE